MIGDRLSTAVLVGLYLSSIVVANLSVLWLGQWVVPITSFVLIGCDITVRDGLHERWHDNNLIQNMGFLIAGGSILTCVVNFNAFWIALASMLAWIVAGVADTIVYEFGYSVGMSRFWRVNGSNVAASVLDSAAFLFVAFGALPPFVFAAQVVLKWLGGFVWSYILIQGE